ncbi:MAG: type II toxin-antitoxin system VapC family toxin [Acidimicrobiia bacterium]|nr:type II toxin-antitoxin system VapC family toxin [Acidimicrobiia bacterium]
MADPLVVDASAMVDLLVGTNPAPAVDEALRDRQLFAPAHFDAEILSALGRLHREGRLSVRQVATRLGRLAEAPIERQPLAPLLAGAWSRRSNLRLVDALYVELAAQLETQVASTDLGLARASRMVDLIG